MNKNTLRYSHRKVELQAVDGLVRKKRFSHWARIDCRVRAARAPASEDSREYPYVIYLLALICTRMPLFPIV